MGRISKLRIVGRKDNRADFFAVPCFERGRPETENLPTAIVRAAGIAASRRGFTAKAGQSSQARGAADRAPAVVVYGLGRPKSLGRAEVVKYATEAIAEAARNGFRNPAVRLPDHAVVTGGDAAEALLRAIALTGYRFEDFRSRPKRAPARTVRVAVALRQQEVYRSMVPRAVATAEGAVLARNLANTPPNEAYPESMAERAREMAGKRGIKVEVLGPKELEKKGMGGILAVGRGSRKSPRLVMLEWGDGSERISLVGKGVTFDTGGISIKPAAAMDEMKFDKSGACTVLGIADAAAALDLPYRFRAYVALAENMPDGDAYRPGDIVRCYGGKTVEILNTDAEGRMLLADALALASEDGADTILDYATLTGACVVALGHSGAGLFSHNDELARELLEAAAGAGERLWRLPLWQEFTEQIKGAHGDLSNSGGRWGGASTAAAFLSEFVSTPRWAHLDIAGPAYVGRSDKGTFGSTGYGVALTIAWLERRAG